MPRQEPYTCGRCTLGPPLRRCTKCRKKRAERKREWRAKKTSDGLCVDCTARAEVAPDGTLYSRCRVHRLLNNRLSAASHSS